MIKIAWWKRELKSSFQSFVIMLDKTLIHNDLFIMDKDFANKYMNDNDFLQVFLRYFERLS